MNQTIRIVGSTRTEAVLHMALELGASEWKLGFGVEAGRKESQRTVVAGDTGRLVGGDPARQEALWVEAVRSHL